MNPANAFDRTIGMNGIGEFSSATFGGDASVLLYAQQEPVDPTNPNSTMLRRAAHLMVAAVVALKPTNALAIYDFSIGSDGEIAEVTEPMPALPVIDGAVSSNGAFTAAQPANGRFSMPDATATADGTFTGAALGQVDPMAAPCLIEGGDGLVHCYYQDRSTNTLMVAHYDPVATRTSCRISWNQALSAIPPGEQQTGNVDFIVSRTGSSTAGAAVTITPNPAPLGALNPELVFGDVTIDYGSGSGIPAETWENVPLELKSFLAVLNGSASVSSSATGVIAGTTPYYDYTGARQILILPAVAADGSPSSLTLVSVKGVTSFSATTCAGTTTGVKVTLTIDGQQQLWDNLPEDAGETAAILQGGGGQSYAYPPPVPVGPGSLSIPFTVVPAPPGAQLASWNWTPTVKLPLQPSGFLVITGAGGVESITANLDYENPDGNSLSFILTLAFNDSAPQIWKSLPGILDGMTAVIPAEDLQTILQGGDVGYTYPPAPTGLPAIPFSVSLTPDTPDSAYLFVNASGDATATTATAITEGCTPTALTGMAAMTAIATSPLPDNGIPAVICGDAGATTAGLNGAWKVATPVYGFLPATTRAPLLTAAKGYSYAAGATVEAWIKPVGGIYCFFFFTSQFAGQPQASLGLVSEGGECKLTASINGWRPKHVTDPMPVVNCSEWSHVAAVYEPAGGVTSIPLQPRPGASIRSTAEIPLNST